MHDIIKWGILAPGKIAHKFAQDILLANGHELVAVGSRNVERAKTFAQQYGARFFGSYEDVMSQREVDIIYVASPHHAHAGLTIQSMNAGKHVLCEKPLAVNKKDVKRMIAVSREKNVFLMEGLWTRFNPSIQHMLQLINQGEIGEIKYINADFTFNVKGTPAARIDQTELAGGALLDVGIYPAFLSYLILGIPIGISADARFYPTGADCQTVFNFTYQNAMSNLMAGFITNSDGVAHICGTKGRIDILSRWHEASRFTIYRGTEKETHEFPILGNGFVPEIIECGNCLKSSKIESELWSHRNSLELITILDEVRARIGLVYPFE